MAIIDTITNYTRLYDDLKRVGRDNFSCEGAYALMEYLDQSSDDTGENIKYDPIAFCCDFMEYAESEYEELASEYSEAPQREDFEDSEDHAEELIDWFSDQTIVIPFNGGVVMQVF